MPVDKLLEYITIQIESIKRKDAPMLVSLDGVDTSGKTTLSRLLAEYLNKRGHSTIQASIDRFHNPAEKRYILGSKSPEGYYKDSFDYDSLKSCLLEPLKNDLNRKYYTAVYDFKTESKVHQEPRIATKESILIMEGVFLLRPELIEYWDYSIFLHIDFEQVILRAKDRDQYLFGSEEEIENRYRNKYIPGQQMYLRESDPFSSANIMIDNNDFNNPKIVRAGNEIAELRRRALDFK
jgi:uridine kinase